MLDKDRVFQRFLLFSDLQEEATARYRPLCDAAISLLCRKAKAAPDPEDLDRLYTVAAGYAYCDWLSLGTGAPAAQEEVKVGDVSFKRSSGSSAATAAAELREYFDALAADLLEPPFVLGRTSRKEAEA